MNDRCNIFIYSIITAQHLLNKPLDKRETNKRVLFLFQQPFLIVEKLLRYILLIISIIMFLFINSTKEEWYYRDSSCSLVTV